MYDKTKHVPPSERPLNWRDEAACVGVDPDLFFPSKRGGFPPDQIERARKVCHGCPAIMRCLQYAVEEDIRYGIWGGLTEKERAMRKTAVQQRKLSEAALLRYIDSKIR